MLFTLGLRPGHRIHRISTSSCLAYVVRPGCYYSLALVSAFADTLNHSKSASEAPSQGETSRRAQDVDDVSPDLILRTLAWQVARNDLIYRKDLASTSTRALDTSDLKELWHRLFASPSSSRATFFLLIDGIDNLSEKHDLSLRILMRAFDSTADSARNPCVKLFLSSTPKRLQELTASLKSPIETIDLADHNAEDVRKYLHAKVDTMDVFQNSSQQVQELKIEVCDALLDIVNGDFARTNYLLKAMNGKQRPQEIHEILAKARKSGREADISHEIARCNQSLSVVDIEDLNVLLFWVINAKQTLDIRDLQSVLFFRHHETSLRSIRQRIKENFWPFLSTSSDEDRSSVEVSLTSDSVRLYSEQLPKGSHLRHPQKQSEVTKSEVRLAKNLLRALCDEDLYQRLGAEAFLNSKLSSGDKTIFVECGNAAQAIMARDCLQIMLDLHNDIEDDLAAISSYCAWYWYDHMAGVDLSLTSPDLKADVGRYLIEIFHEDESIKRMQDSSRASFSWHSEHIVEEQLLKWLRDSAVVEGLTQDQKEWCKTVCSSPAEAPSRLCTRLSPKVA